MANQKKIMKSINHLSQLVQVNWQRAAELQEMIFFEKENMVVFPNMNEAAVDIVDELLPSVVSHDLDKQDFTPEEVATSNLKMSWQTAFAGTLFRKIFSLKEMKGWNCRGVGSKERLLKNKFNEYSTSVYLNIILILSLN